MVENKKTVEASTSNQGNSYTAKAAEDLGFVFDLAKFTIGAVAAAAVLDLGLGMAGSMDFSKLTGPAVDRDIVPFGNILGRLAA